MAADTIFVPDSLDDSACSMPWDEAGDYSDNVPTTTRALQAGVDEDNSLMDGRLSNQWRRIGEARRKFILQEDRRKGGTSFDLNPSCNINRYFQVAHRVSDGCLTSMMKLQALETQFFKTIATCTGA